MKKCPLCGTISSEKDHTCGVCGTSLDAIKAEPETVNSVEQHSVVATLSTGEVIRADRRKQGILGILVGIGMVATGFLTLQIVALVGILLILFGFTVIATDISWMRGNTFYDQDEPILHGRAPLNHVLSYSSSPDETHEASTENQPNSLSQQTDEKNN